MSMLLATIPVREPGSNPNLSVAPEPAPITKAQYTAACAWYDAHREHIDKLLVGAGSPYPPGREDVGRPELWKPEHWAWFLCYVDGARKALMGSNFSFSKTVV